MAGLYVHVPFCHSECTYCDFYRVSYREEMAERYLDALAIELASLPPGFVPDTIYTGGGTPSALKESQLERLLALLHPWRAAGQEYTFEVNPASTTPAKVVMLASAGVTRVSFGVQTFDPRALLLLGRRRREGDAERALDLLRGRIPSISFDLIFALPGQGRDEWAKDVDRALSLSPDHLSLYSLIYEPGTPLSRRVAAGELSPAGEEDERAMFLHAIGALTTRGYEHYEVSSYARPGHRSRHNQSYWDQEDYHGVGPGACSTVGDCRRVNEPDLEAYVRGLAADGAPPRREERLTELDRANEMILLKLRTADGLALDDFRERWGKDLAQFPGGRLGGLLAGGFLEAAGGRIRLTAEGLCVADRVIAEIMASMPAAS